MTLQPASDGPIVSVCIPTYNRAPYLENCLAAVIASCERVSGVEVCVSDNCSDDTTPDVVADAERRMEIRYQRNERNVGAAANIMRVVAMARGTFVWILGDDDLLLPHALEHMCALLETHPTVDFFFANGFNLDAEHVFRQPQPFDTTRIPSEVIASLRPNSMWLKSGELPFMDLINPARCRDFLGGMWAGVFRRKQWLEHVGIIDMEGLEAGELFYSLDATYPHAKVWANAYARSIAYFCAMPQVICLNGARAWWKPRASLVHIVRIPELLLEYRRHGLPLRRYLRYRNWMLTGFFSSLVDMRERRSESGYELIDPMKLVLQNLLYSNFYRSFVFHWRSRGRDRFGKAMDRYDLSKRNPQRRQ